MDETAKQATHMCVGPRCWECGEPEELFHMRQRLIMPALFALREEHPEADHHALARTAAQAIREDVLRLLGFRNQELDGLYARLRDAEDARQAAVGVIQRQNETLASVRALHCDLGSGVCEECSAPLRYPFLPVPYPCRTVRLLDGKDGT